MSGRLWGGSEEWLLSAERPSLATHKTVCLPLDGSKKPGRGVTSNLRSWQESRAVAGKKGVQLAEALEREQQDR